MVQSSPFATTTVPSPGFGAMGLSFRPSLEEAEPVLLKAVELGCTLWDTAVSDFTRKHNVRGKIFSSSPDQFASKCGFNVFGGPVSVTHSASHIKEYIEGTIERLGFTPDFTFSSLEAFSELTSTDTPLEESISALDEIRKAGKTKYIGLSECSAETLRKANSIAKIDAVQAEYSAFETIHETDGLITTAKELSVAYVAFSPLGYGWLVDNFDFRSPDDFAPDNFRRTDGAFDEVIILVPPFNAIPHTDSKELLDPEIHRTKGILRVIKDKASSVKRVIITSLFIAIVSIERRPDMYSKSRLS
ncbi:uncharacterized protein N7496_007580 [Penicillium cataractarum]|uniref:NADP-dependent oxidoreductase domain-containing protein n=1 Tax=Penicillium cataractarum TaxID=2100454 RepID=A0A9W9S8C8_9EURO|nr:uncharacterized protein N7496_007580 [Penicillium cataractarum]KAJ5371488.1 hypothetical protein N7496_007580 [Penicillium cataractarum]